MPHGISGCAACQGLGVDPADSYYTMTVGHVALAGAGGILLGMLLTWLYCERRG